MKLGHIELIKNPTLCFLPFILWVMGYFFQSFSCMLNMIHHCSWETGFKIKGVKLIFGCLDWLCERCWLAVGYPDQLSLIRHVQLFKSTHTMKTLKLESLSDGEQLDMTEPLSQRLEHLWRCSEVQECYTWRWNLKTWAEHKGLKEVPSWFF